MSASALSYCPTCELPAPEGRCPRCASRRANAYSNARPVTITVNGYQVDAYIYDRRDTLAPNPPPLARAYSGRKGAAAEYVELPLRRDGDTVTATDIRGRKPIPSRLGNRDLIAIVTAADLAKGKLHVKWNCRTCGASGRMLASAWVQKHRTLKLRGLDCEYCGDRRRNVGFR